MPRHRPQDHFGHRARKEGYPARSVYKLQEIDRRVRLLRPGAKVLDLGAAPGSWSLYAAERVGASGLVIGVDREPVRVAPTANLRFLQMDIEALNADSLGDTTTFDVVLSDMAPKTSGQRQSDQFQSFELYMHALRVAGQRLAAGGQFVGKIFQGQEFQQARTETQRLFRQVRIIKPEASRDESYEIFLFGSGLKP